MSNNPYNFCTRCGDELDEEVSEAYLEADVKVPPICRTCFVEMTTGAMRPIADFMVAFNESMAEFIGQFNEVVESLDVDGGS